MEHFTHIEMSDAAYENSGIRFITVNTKHLKGRGDVCVYVPPGVPTGQSLPIYILLHGVYGSSWVWAFKGGAAKCAAHLIESNQIAPAIIAMPSDGLWEEGSAYLSHSKLRFDKWVVEDVPRLLIETIPQATVHSPICIGGLSMGGFGAFHLGFTYPERFSAISAHSALTDLSQMTQFVSTPQAKFEQENPISFGIVEAAIKASTRRPPFRFDCGIEDSLLFANRKLHAEFSKHQIVHKYEEFEGSHEWTYWRDNLKHSLLFFNKHTS